jgi:hypothetical protein
VLLSNVALADAASATSSAVVSSISMTKTVGYTKDHRGIAEHPNTNVDQLGECSYTEGSPVHRPIHCLHFYQANHGNGCSGTVRKWLLRNCCCHAPNSHAATEIVIAPSFCCLAS